MCTFITLLKTLTVLWALSEQLIVHVSTDPWRWCDRFIIWTFLALQKESQVKSRNDIIYTGFHMQLRSWKLKLQPKVMSYLEKRHVTHHPALSSMNTHSLCLCHSHTQTHIHTNITSNADHTADGHLFLFLLLSYSVQSTYVGFVSIFTWFMVLKDLIEYD